MHDARTQALLDDIEAEIDELAADTSRAELALLLERRAEALAPGTPGRAEWLAHAGERWELAADLPRAARCYAAAVEDGGASWIDARAPLVGVLLALGENRRAEETMAALRRDLAVGAVTGPVHDFVGEALEQHQRYREALRWFDAGLTSAQLSDPDDVDLSCLNGHFRVRRALGLPHDRFDALCEERRREALADLDAEDGAGSGDSASRRSVTLTVLYWPAEELARVLARWPQLAEDYGADPADHRSVVEGHLRGLAEHGGPVTVAAGTAEEYVDYARRQGRDPADHATRAAYAAHLGLLDRGTAWPPGRNAPCWCGSGRKYKKCCGALRLLGGTTGG